jgi:DNA-3-methyladenine glycosylase II
VRDLAEKTLSGVVKPRKELETLSVAEIIARLTEVRGIGEWTVQMLLIFKLGRQDVLPAADYGVRQGFKLVYGGEDLPKPKDLLVFGEKWRPYRTVAAWYLWRVLDAGKSGGGRA